LKGIEMTITELIDKRYAKLQEQEAIGREIAELDGEILTLLLEAGEKQAFGSQGIGYSITSTTRYDFGAAAYTYLDSKGLLGHFIPAPKITKTKIDALIKDGELSYGDMAEIEKWMTVEQSPYALRKVVSKEAQKAVTG
jgi:hypothetical protein